MEKLKTKKKTLIAVLIAIIAVGAVGAFATYNHFNQYEDTIDITGLTKEEIQDSINQKVKDGEINVQYTLNATVDGKRSEAEDFMIRNIAANKDDIEFSIYDEKNDQIYSSKKVQRGQQVAGITLNKKLSAGKHDCRIKIGYVEKGNISSMFPLNLTVK